MLHFHQVHIKLPSIFYLKLANTGNGIQIKANVTYKNTA